MGQRLSIVRPRAKVGFQSSAPTVIPAKAGIQGWGVTLFGDIKPFAPLIVTIKRPWAGTSVSHKSLLGYITPTMSLRLKNVPSSAFRKADYQSLEGVMDVSRGAVRASSPGLHGGRDERSGSLPGVWPAPEGPAHHPGSQARLSAPTNGGTMATER